MYSKKFKDMKKIILVTLIAFLSFGFVKAQRADLMRGPVDLITHAVVMPKDSMMNGMYYGHKKVRHEKNGNHFLGQSFNDSLCGLNYVYGSVLIETRSSLDTSNILGVGFPATIPIAGLSPCDSIIKAYLYWIVSYTSTDTTTTPTLDLTNPSGSTSVTAAAFIGSDGPKCWGELGTYVFRADITVDIAGNGNYTITNIVGEDTYGVDGATLIIIYKDPSATYKGTMIINDGCFTESNGGNPESDSITNFYACANPINASAFILASDLQSSVGPTHTDSLNGIPIDYPNNFYNFDVTTTTVIAGQTSSEFGIIPGSGDCYTWAVMGLYYQTNCTTCTPITAPLPLTKGSTKTTCDSINGRAWVVPSGGTQIGRAHV